MSRNGCPKEPEVLAALRRGAIDAPIAMHVASCPSCGPAVAAERALGRIAGAPEDARPFPSAATLRLEGELRREERRLARKVLLRLAIHAGAVALSLGLLATVRLMEQGLEARTAVQGHAGSICALTVVMLSIWNLYRTADESAMAS